MSGVGCVLAMGGMSGRTHTCGPGRGEKSVGIIFKFLGAALRAEEEVVVAELDFGGGFLRIDHHSAYRVLHARSGGENWQSGLRRIGGRKILGHDYILDDSGSPAATN